MKLNMIFIVMDLLTLLMYPLVFIYGVLHRLLRKKERVALANSLVPVLNTPNSF